MRSPNQEMPRPGVLFHRPSVLSEPLPKASSPILSSGQRGTEVEPDFDPRDFDISTSSIARRDLPPPREKRMINAQARDEGGQRIANSFNKMKEERAENLNIQENESDLPWLKGSTSKEIAAPSGEPMNYDPAGK